jgi:hypothetical protein
MVECVINLLFVCRSYELQLSSLLIWNLDENPQAFVVLYPSKFFSLVISIDFFSIHLFLLRHLLLTNKNIVHIIHEQMFTRKAPKNNEIEVF